MKNENPTITTFLKENLQSEIKESFYFVLSQKEIQDLIGKILKKSLIQNVTKEYLLNQIITQLRQKITEVLSNEQKIIDCFLNFINQNLKNKKYPESIEEIEKLITFIEDLEIDYTVDLNIKLLAKSKVLYNLVETIYKQKKEQIWNNDGIDLFTDELGNLIVKGYCFYNDIDLTEIIENDFQKLKESDNYICDDLKMYLKEIASIPLLTQEQEQHLGLRILQNDQEAEKLLVKHNLKLAVHVAKRFVGNGLDLLDLIQEGNLGLMKAASKYDVTKGYRFSTYAFNWIEQFIKRSLADQSKLIRQPVHFFEKLKTLQRTENELVILLNRQPTIKELELATGFTEKVINDLLVYNREVISYNTLIGDEDSELEILLPDESPNPEEEVIKNVSLEEFRKILETMGLTSKELDIILLRNGFIDGNVWTLEKIAKKYNVTRERIRQVEAKALVKIKRNRNVKNLFSEHYKNSFKYTSLYALLQTNSTEVIKLALNKLYPEELAIITNYFDNNFQIKTEPTVDDKLILEKHIIPTLKTIISNPNFERSKPQWLIKQTQAAKKSPETYSSLFELLSTTPEVLTNILPKLYPEEYFLIIKRFGRDLCTLNVENFTPFENEILYTSIYKTLKRLIKNPNIHHYLPNWIFELRKNDIFLEESIKYLQANNYSPEEIIQIFPNAESIIDSFKLKKVF